MAGEALPIRLIAAVMLYTQSTYAMDFSAAALVAIGLVLIWRRSRRIVGFCLLWTLVFLAPLTLSPGPAHRYYLSGGGYAFLAAAALAEMAASVWEATRRRVESPEETPPVASGASAIQ
jgi:hypothetical protein